MDYAAFHGRLDAIQFLHASRQEGCTVLVKSSAAANDHFEIFEWLKQNRSEGFDSDLTDESTLKRLALHSSHGHFGWFLDKFIDCADFERCS